MYFEMNQRSEDVGRRLYEACSSGSVLALESLIEEDQFILDRVSSVAGFFNETPLHLAALRGHLDFTKALLTRKPKFASELDLQRCSPLHLASIEGHVEIVQELLQVNPNVCFARDQDGRIPLHLAAMKGRVDVILELLRAEPKSIHEKLGRGETVFHLCVKYNKLEALKTLVQYLQINDKEFDLLSSGDDDGNTVLHLAAALKQIDTIEYLLGIKSVKDQANVKNQNGSTALDVVEHCPNRDLKTMEIREILLQASVRRSVCGGLDSKPESPADNPPPPPPSQRRCKAGVILQSIYSFWIKYFKVNHTWLKEVRGHLITAATLTATMAFQAILSPPGGFWQDSAERNLNVTNTGGFWQESGEGPHIAGVAIMDSRTYHSRYYLSNSSNITGSSIYGSNINGSSIYGSMNGSYGSYVNGSYINGSDFNYGSYYTSDFNYGSYYTLFDYFYIYSGSPLASYLLINTVMLMASLCTIMLALSGFPTDNKLLIWLLIFTVYITISCMGYGYVLAMSFVYPFVFEYYMLPVVEFIFYCWIGLCGFVLVLHTCHFCVWLWNKFADLKWMKNKFRNLEWAHKKFEWLRNKFGNLVNSCTRSRGPRAFQIL